MYTHYWYRDTSKKVSYFQWRQITQAFRETYAQCLTEDIDLVREFDQPDTMPLCNEEEIIFNGSGDEGHETMVLERVPTGRERNGEVFAFIKSNRKEYDVAVCALLLAAEKYTPGVWRIESDGDCSDWAAGLVLFETAIGEEPPNLACLIKAAKT